MSEETIGLIRACYAAYSRGDLDGFIEFFTEDVELRRIDYGGRRWKPLIGREDARFHFGSTLGAWKQVERQIEEVRDLGEGRYLVLCRWLAHAFAGPEFDEELVGGDVITVRDQKIVRFDEYLERTEALEAAGLSE